MNNNIADKLVDMLNDTSQKNIDEKNISSKSFLNLFNKFFLGEQKLEKNMYIDTKLDFKEQKIKSFDDIKLSSLIFENNSKKWVIGIHGYSSQKESSIYNIWFLKELGYNLVTFDFRNHGQSDIDCVTFGIKEKEDLKSIISFINDKYRAEEIILFGLSMGAFTLNNVFLNDNSFLIKHNVIAGISDSTYKSINEVIKKLLPTSIPLLGSYMEKIIEEINQSYKNKYNINLQEASVCKPDNYTELPILFIHSKKDKVTNYQDSIDIYYFRKKYLDADELMIFEDGEHIRTIIQHEEEYKKGVINFLNKIKKENE